MQNRHAGTVLPEGFVREGFYLCCEAGKLAGVYSFKFERTEFLLNCGGRVGYAAEILRQGLILAKGAGFDRFLAVCDKDNLASEKVILKNGGIREDKRCDKEEQVFVKRVGSTYKKYRPSDIPEGGKILRFFGL